MEIRRFRPSDAEFCFRVRTNAFVIEFLGELGPEAAAAGVNAYLPADYARMAREIEFFIAEEGGRRVGFLTIRRVDRTTAEIPLIYLDLPHIGRGFGSACIRFIEGWIAENWPEVSTLVLDTVIPKYNGGFYSRAGFAPVGETFCELADRRVPAVRFAKQLGA